MRTIGTGVLVFALVGAFLFLSQSQALKETWQKAIGSDPARYDDASQAVLASLDVDGRNVFGAPVMQGAPVILSGLPAYAGMEFRLPVDARPTSGDFDLSFTTLVAQDVQGVLRISINGTRRADYLLKQGENVDSVQVQLTPEELASGVVNVSLSLQGRGSSAQCTSEDAIPAVVAINGASGLRLNLDAAPQSARDQLALWGNRIPVNLADIDADGDAQSDYATVIHQSAILAEKGYNPVVTGNGVSLETLRSLAGETSRQRAFAIPANYPIPLSSDPSNEGLRKFTKRASWGYDYSVEDLPTGRLPSALDLKLKVGPASESLQRSLVVTLNDRLLFSRRIAQGVEDIDQSIIIPAKAHSRTNALNIAVSAYDTQDNPCGNLVQSVAELLPETVLVAGEASLQNEIGTITAALTRVGSVRFETPSLTTPDNVATIGLLAALAPAKWEISPNSAGAIIETIPAGTSAKRLTENRAKDGMVSWIVYLPEKTGARVTAKRLPAQGSLELPTTALLVSVVVTNAQDIEGSATP